MKFTISNLVLKEAVQDLAGIIEKRSTMTIPILGNLLIKTISEDKLMIIANDMEIGVQRILNADIEEEGSITVNAKLLQKITKELPDGPIDFEELENYWVKLSSGNIEFKLMGVSAENFPEMPEIKNVNFEEINSEVWETIIEKTYFSAGNEDSKKIYRSVYVEYRDKYILGVATNTHRMAVIKYPIEPEEVKEIPGLVIPIKVAVYVKDLLKRDIGNYRMATDGKYIAFKCGENDEYYIISKLIEGKYPDYKIAVPEKFVYEVILPREDVLEAVRRIGIVANQQTNHVIFTFKPSKLIIRGESIDLGEGHQDIEIDYSDEDEFNINLNKTYLIDCLKSIDTDDIIFKFISEEKAVMIAPSEKKEFDYFHLMMPLIFKSDFEI